MKKITTIILSMLMIIAMSGCAKKKDIILLVKDSHENVFNYAIQTKANTIEGLLAEIAKGGTLKYKADSDGNIITLQDSTIDSDNNSSYWKTIINGEEGTYPVSTPINDGDKIEYIYTVEQNEPVMLGGWQVAEDYHEQLTDEERSIFEKGTKGLVGVGYTPIRVLATQLVSGTNYAYLAQGKTVTATPETDYYVIKIYNDLQGNCELKAINKLNITDLQLKDVNDTGVLGGWQISDTGKAGMLSNENAQASFEKATKELLGMQYNPIQLLATQLVSGTNYKALCLGKTVTAQPTLDLYVVEWYEDLQGNVQVNDVGQLNLEYYVTSE